MKDSAFAIKIGDRFFYKFGKKGQVQTAHCLAGAFLIQKTHERDVQELVEKLWGKHKDPEVVEVSVR